MKILHHVLLGGETKEKGSRGGKTKRRGEERVVDRLSHWKKKGFDSDTE